MQLKSQQRDIDWWQGALIYQIYPRSFKDSNQDGIGDINGIISKLDYLSWLGIDAIWISPFFTSPMRDFGYDVSDYRNVDPMFGTLQEFKLLLQKAHNLDIKIIIDQVISHSSSDHPWFIESQKDKHNHYSDWYVWADPKADGTAPNNWLSVFGGSAWQFNARRGQYYLHHFLESQPDLNFFNPQVTQQLLADIEFWLQLGVDGVRLDACNFYYHDDKLRDNPPLPPEQSLAKNVELSNPYAMQQHIFDISRPQSLEFHKQIRQLLDRYPGCISIGEIGADDALKEMANYLNGGDKLHLAYTFDLLTTDFTAAAIYDIIDQIQTNIGQYWPCLSYSNHDVVRTASRTATAGDPLQVFCVMALLCSLRGSICIYQGEELGLQEAELSFEQLQDPFGINFWPEFKGRDGCRTPMVWDDSLHGGFSNCAPWLPIADSHWEHNVKAQTAIPNSLLNKIRLFWQWRAQQPALIKGKIQLIYQDKQLLVFTRNCPTQQLLIAFNLSDKKVKAKVNQPFNSINGHGFDGDEEACSEAFTLRPWSGLYLDISAQSQPINWIRI